MRNRFLWDEVVVNFFIGFENLCSPCCLVPVSHLPSPSRSINSTDEEIRRKALGHLMIFTQCRTVQVLLLYRT